MGKRFKFINSLDMKDCGPTCLKMVAAFYGMNYPIELVREQSYLSRNGVNLLNLSEASKALGLDAMLYKFTLNGLYEKSIPLPCILHWNQDHFVVLYKIKIFASDVKFYVADPAIGKLVYNKRQMQEFWCQGQQKGVALLLEPLEGFQFDRSAIVKEPSQYKFILHYLKNYRKPFLLLATGMVLTTCLSLMFPFLTQYMIDVGLKFHNYQIVVLIVSAQFFLFLGDTSISIIRGWVLLHLNSRIGISIISDFLKKLLHLPLTYFEAKTIGDINQRVSDHHRIENFMSSNLINVCFSMINIMIYLVILSYYNLLVFGVFLFFSVTGIVWVLLFMRKRKQLDYDRFRYDKKTQENVYDIFNGIPEIKLNQAENKKRQEWENNQISLFRVGMRSLKIEQSQRVGYLFFSNLKNLLLTFIAATAVLNGTMTLGMLLSVSYIIGQTNGPLEQLLSFISTGQDARISITRLQDILEKEDEDAEYNSGRNQEDIIEQLPVIEDIQLQNVTFQYDGPHSMKVLNDLSVVFPGGKVTAIVGTSGCGKTTLIKMLLRFYEPTIGIISVGDLPLNTVPAKVWRRSCGAVMQDGYIFSDTILQNITLSENSSEVDKQKLEQALYIANIEEMINELPNGLATEIGLNGSGISAGQKQRILIARAVYKDPSFLIFDEATSALDANTERVVIERLASFFKKKTVIIIAHRLSTVVDADQIIVMDHGTVKECGTHPSLVEQKSMYYELVKNQLELGV